MSYQLLIGDCREKLRELATGSVQTCVTSPPYFGLRDYGMPNQIGLEQTPQQFVAELVGVFREVWRVLADDGTLWVNLGDSYAHSTRNTDTFTRSRTECAPGNLKQHGLKVRDLIGIPWRVAFALQDDGWYLRQDIIWHKPNPMPESVTSRCTKAHEYIFLLSKQPKYYFDADGMREPVAASQVGRVRADRVGGTSHKERGQHSIGHVYTGERKQLKRARELAEKGGLTADHIAAIRACGITDTGKAQHTQNGHGQNSEETQRLAAEAKTVLGGYYREFLTRPRVSADRKDLRTDTESRHRSAIEGGQSLQTEPDGYRNKRSVWTVPTAPYADAHFATFPPALITPCILAGSRPGDTVLDVFNGSGTTGEVALTHGRQYIGIELNPEYATLTHKRLALVQTSFLGALHKH